MKNSNPTNVLFVVALTLSLMMLCSGSAFGVVRGGGGEQPVKIEASIAQRLIFELAGGGSVSLVADPINQPTAQGESDFSVSTNVGSYAISATFGAFEVGDSDYDLIGGENFMIKSVPPGEGDAVFDWTVPSEEMTILSGENGLTNGETTKVLYQLSVDFSVPTGGASTTIVYTATASM